MIKDYTVFYQFQIFEFPLSKLGNDWDLKLFLWDYFPNPISNVGYLVFQSGKFNLVDKLFLFTQLLFLVFLQQICLVLD
jgi:hypothetical protein